MSILRKLVEQTKQIYNFIILSFKLKKNPINYFLFATSISVLILLFIPTTFGLIFANIYLIFLTIYHDHIFKNNKFIKIIIVLWVLSLILYALTLFITVDNNYINIVVFAIRQLVFSLIFIITLITSQDLPAVQIFQDDYATFNEGPSKNNTLFAFIRKYHVSIIFLSFISYSLATSVFLENQLISNFFGILSLVFASLYLVQSIAYLIAFWKKPLNKSSSLPFKNSSKKKKNDPRGQTRTMFSGMTAHMTNPGVRKAVVTCVECAKGLGTLVVGGEMMYKLSAGGMNAVSPPRQWVLNQMFPDDRTKIWTEIKAGHALQNRAMGNPHDNIYQMQDMWSQRNQLMDQIKSNAPKNSLPKT